MWTYLAQSLTQKLKANADYPGSLILDALSISQRYGQREFIPLPRPHGQDRICTPRLLIILTKLNCLHNRFWHISSISAHFGISSTFQMAQHNIAKPQTISPKTLIFLGDFDLHFHSKKTQFLRLPTQNTIS